jgi:hypothetical protein
MLMHAATLDADPQRSFTEHAVARAESRPLAALHVETQRGFTRPGTEDDQETVAFAGAGDQAPSVTEAQMRWYGGEHSAHAVEESRDHGSPACGGSITHDGEAFAQAVFAQGQSAERAVVEGDRPVTRLDDGERQCEGRARASRRAVDGDHGPARDVGEERAQRIGHGEAAVGRECGGSQPNVERSKSGACFAVSFGKCSGKLGDRHGRSNVSNIRSIRKGARQDRSRPRQEGIKTLSFRSWRV